MAAMCSCELCSAQGLLAEEQTEAEIQPMFHSLSCIFPEEGAPFPVFINVPYRLGWF